MDRHIIGIDHGNGHVKARANTIKLNLPSAYARPTDFGEEFTNKHTSYDLNTYTLAKYDGESFVWGPDVTKSPHLINTYTGENRYKQKPYKVLSEIALSELVPDGINVINGALVVTGCPSREKGTELEKELIDVYRGGHVVSKDGQSVIINVKDVEVLPQPLGTVMDQYLDDDGFVIDEDYEKMYVGVIDLGSGTTDLDGVRELRRQKSDMHTIPIGLIGAYQEIARIINEKKPNLNATYQEVEVQIRAGNEVFVRSQRATFDEFVEVKQRVFRQLADDLITAILNKWPDRSKFDRLLLTGGGACVPELAKAFKQWESDLIVVDNGQFANANGFYKYGKLLAQQ